MSVEEGTVFETDASRMFLTSPNTIFVRDSGTLLADGNYSYLLAPVSCPLRILFDSNDGIYVFPLLNTADTAQNRKEEQDEESGTGVQTVAAYSYREIQAGGTTTYRNLITMGSSMFLTAPYINSPVQSALAAMDIRASKKTIDIVGLGIFTIAIPLCILAAGLVVYRKRRNL